MKAINNLVSQNLSYIHSDHESGSNGAKKQFHTKSKAFLRALAKDLGFIESKVTSNPGGIAVSGEITLMGMWRDGNGLYLQIFQSLTQRKQFMFRHISHMNDYVGGSNHWLSNSIFEAGDYEGLVDLLLVLRKFQTTVRSHVA